MWVLGKWALYLHERVLCLRKWDLNMQCSTLYFFSSQICFNFCPPLFPPVLMSFENSLDVHLCGCCVCDTCECVMSLYKRHCTHTSWGKKGTYWKVKRETEKDAHVGNLETISQAWCSWQVWMSHVTHANESCHVWMSHKTSLDCLTKVVFVTSINESWHTCEWVMSHMRMSHFTYANDSCHTCEWVASQMKESWSPVRFFDHGGVRDKYD